MRSSSLLLTVCLLFSLSLGCDFSEETPSYSIVDPGGKADWGHGEDALTDVPQVGGAYHLWMISEIVSQDNDSGEIKTYLSEARAISTLTQVGASLKMSTSPCDLSLPALGVGQPTVSTEALRNLPPQITLGSIIPEDGYVRMSMEPTQLVLGAYLDSPDQPLPESSHDLNVIDADDDGKPGVSISVAGFDIYTSLRLQFQLRGWLHMDQSLAGRTAMEIEYTILGDNVPFVDVAKKVASTGDSSTILSQHHEYLMVPVDASQAHCDAIAPHPSTLPSSNELPPLLEAIEEAEELEALAEEIDLDEGEEEEVIEDPADIPEFTDDTEETEETEESDEEEDEWDDDWDDWYF